MGEVFLPEGHPEAGAADRGEVLDERLQLLVVDDVGFALADTGIMQSLVNFVRLGRDPFAVFVITSFLRYFADIDFGVEIGGEGHAVVSGVAVHDVEVVDLVEMVLGGIGGEDRRHARIVSPFSRKRS